MTLQLQIGSETKVLKLNMGFLELQSDAAGILDNSRCLHNINVSRSIRKSQKELVSMNCSVSVGVAVSALG